MLFPWEGGNHWTIRAMPGSFKGVFTPLGPCANKFLTDHVALCKEHKMQVSKSPKEVKVEEQGSLLAYNSMWGLVFSSV